MKGNITSDYAAQMAQAMYPAGVYEGMPINHVSAQAAAQERFIKAQEGKHISIMPVAIPEWDEVLRKAIFSDPYAEAAEVKELHDKNVDYLRKAQHNAIDILEKADSTTSLASSFMHVIADQNVTFLYKRPYPLQAVIPVEANMGKTASWDVVGPYEIASAAAGSEDPTLVESDMTAHNQTDTVKYLYAVGRLTKAVKLAGLTQIPARDVKAIRIDMAQDAIRALRERMMIGVTRNLQSTTNNFQSAGALEYKGIYEHIQANTATPTYITAGASVDTYGEIMKELDNSYNKMVLYGMQPTLAVCDYTTFGIIRRGLAEYIRYGGEPVKTIAPGVQKIDLVFPNNSVSLMPHPFLPMTTGGAYGNIFLLDTRLWARRVLWQDTYEELANINTSDKFVISAAETLIDKSDVDASSSLHGGVFGITI